jgi:protoporphyrinogen oxidase
MPESEMAALAARELSEIGIIDPTDVLDSTVLRMPKTYPAYFGTYERFDELRDYLMRYRNLFMVGRNGMHKYNNQDHSMLTAMTAVDNILEGRQDQSNIWAVNTEMEYHEEKQREPGEEEPLPERKAA